MHLDAMYPTYYSVRAMPRVSKKIMAPPQSPEFLRSLIDSSVDGIFAFDAKLRYTAWNPAMERLTGVPAGRVLGKKIFDVFPEVRTDGEAAYYHNTLAGESGILTDWPFYNVPGHTERFLETYFSPLKNEADKVIGGLAIVRDITDYKATKESLIEAEGKFRALVEAATDLICMVSPEGDFLILNPAWEQLTGWTVQEGLAMNFIDLIHPKDRAQAIKDFEIFKRGDAQRPLQVRFRGKDGQYRIVEASAKSMRENGKVTAILAVARDITQRRAQEEELRMWAHIFRNVDVGIKIDSADGKEIKMVNEGYARMHGYNSSVELMGLLPLSQYSQEAVAELKEHDRLLQKHGYHTFESVHMRKDGSTFPVSIEATIIKDNDGKPRYRALIVRDITSRRELENRVREYTLGLESKVAERTKELKARLRREAQAKAKDEALLSSIGEGVIATDEQARIIFTNQQAESMLGWKTGQMMGKPMHSVFEMHDQMHRPIPVYRRPISIVLKSGKQVRTSEFYCVRRNGTELPVATTTSPVVLDGEIVGAMIVFRDITKEKEVDRVKSEFVSLASHQLRTPLATVNWYAESLLAGRMPGSITDRQKRYLDQIYIASKRMVRLVHDLLNVSKLELGTFGLDPEPIRLPVLVRSVIEEMELQIKTHQINVVQKYDRSIPEIMLDRQLAHIVFHNLISNAIKYTPAGGTVTVEIAYRKTCPRKSSAPECPLGPLIIAAVTDTGYGIPKEDRAKVFTKFFRADNVKVKGQDGTGLGLYIVQSLIKLLKGSVWFRSPGQPLNEKARRMNKGTTFYVAIPIPKRVWLDRLKKRIINQES